MAEVSVIFENDNVLFDRKELKCDISHEGEPTPTIRDLKSIIASKFKVDDDLVIIREVKQLFGIGKSICTVHIYKERRKMLELEPYHILKKNGVIEVGEKKEKEGEAKEGEEKA